MRKWIVSLLVLLTSAATAQIYQWTDSKGNVHYSDSPSNGAKKVILPDVQSYSPPNNHVPENVAKEVEPLIAKPYRTLAIQQPVHDTALHSAPGIVSINVALEPELKDGHKVQLYMDGNPLGEPRTETSISLSNVDRGTHELSVKIVDEDNGVVSESESITFHMKRPNLNTPKKTIPGPIKK